MKLNNRKSIILMANKPPEEMKEKHLRKFIGLREAFWRRVELLSTFYDLLSLLIEPATWKKIVSLTCHMHKVSKITKMNRSSTAHVYEHRIYLRFHVESCSGFKYTLWSPSLCCFSIIQFLCCRCFFFRLWTSTIFSSR
jgi:hypothetical protein